MTATLKEDLRFRIDDIDLPVLSTVATQAMRLISEGYNSAADLEEVIRVDQALAARILRLSNSPVFSGKHKVRSISQAVTRLGVQQLRATLFIAASSQLFDDRDTYVKEFWEHSLATALISNWLSEQYGIGEPEECFVAGLLHDVGKVLIYRQAPEAYGKLICEAADRGVRFYQYEKEVMEFCSHDAVGALVGMKWGLNQETVEAIGNHHYIEEREDFPEESKLLIALISVASLLANQSGYGPVANSTLEVLNSIPAKLLGVTHAKATEFAEVVPSLVQDYGSIFG